MENTAIVDSILALPAVEFVPYWNGSLLLLGKHVEIAAFRNPDRIDLLRALETTIVDQSRLVICPFEGDSAKTLADLSFQETSDAAFHGVKRGELSRVLSDQEAFVALIQQVTSENREDTLRSMKEMIFLGSLESLAAGVIRGFMLSQDSPSQPSLAILDGRKLYSSSMSKIQINKAKKAEMAKRKFKEDLLREKAMKSLEEQVTVRKDIFPSSSDESNFAEGRPTSEEDNLSEEGNPPTSDKGKGKRKPAPSISKPKKMAKSAGVKGLSAIDKVFSDSEEDLDEVSVEILFSFLSPLVCF
jgi:hypothetical protein